jgi:pyoverdine/dityrosine biosynthesis protein Dit1/AcrR family transcriptional regulator
MTRKPTAELRTRQRLLEAAIVLLAEHGLTAGLLEAAARAAQCPITRAKIYFGRDEDVVLALYLRLASDLEEHAADLPAGTIANRFRAAMLAKLDLVSPHREALLALLATALDPRHELGALGHQTELVRSRVGGVFSAVVFGASDRPKPPADEELIRVLYGMHLAILLLWTQDRTSGLEATRAAVDLAGDVVSRIRATRFVPGLRGSLAKLDGLVAPLVAPRPDLEATDVARRILGSLFRHRRLQPGAGACADLPCDECFALHLPRVRRAVLAGEPVRLLLPAFPAKSPNPRKVLGELPDMAEEVALVFLQSVADEIRAIYPPGVVTTVCSDGRVFGDLVGVTDHAVTRYGMEIAAIVDRLGLKNIEVFGLEDLFETQDFHTMRGELARHYAEPLAALEARTRDHERHRALFNGIHRFMVEDRAILEPEKSRNRIRTECKSLAYEVIRRSNAWGRLVSECFPLGVRLSIHPQHPHSEKIGILLGDAEDAWLTPWHAVALSDRGRVRLVQRHQAEALGARVVERDGRPSHFERVEGM